MSVVYEELCATYLHHFLSASLSSHVIEMEVDCGQPATKYYLRYDMIEENSFWICRAFFLHGNASNVFIYLRNPFLLILNVYP